MTISSLKPRTIEYALAVVRQVFNHARRSGFYDGDSPTKLVKKPKVNTLASLPGTCRGRRAIEEFGRDQSGRARHGLCCRSTAAYVSGKPLH